jgi:hypothetical protein
VAILVFIGATAAMTAMGRSSFGIAQALASRYATPSAVFWAALTTLAVTWLHARSGKILLALGLLGAATLVSMAAVVVAQREFRLAGQFRTFELQRASDALISAVDDVAKIRILFPDMNLVNNVMLPVLKARQLNIFAYPERWPLDTVVPADRLVSEAGQCFGHIDRIELVPNSNAFEIFGWAWDVAARQPFRRVVVLAEDRRVLGYGSSGQGRADVVARVPGVTNFFAGWGAYARAGGALTVYGQRQDGALCRIGETRTP